MSTKYFYFWKSCWVKVFSSATRLYVIDNPVKEPQVSVYPVFKHKKYEHAVLLCQARGMFPDLVRFIWQAVDQNGQNVELGGDERLEHRDKDPEIQIISMLIIDKLKATNNKFTCSVEHNSNDEVKKIPISTDEDICKSESVPALFMPNLTQKAEEKEEEENLNSDLFQLSHSLYLLSVTYVILLMKNVLYFCTISVLLCMRNPANTEMIRSNGR